MAGGKAKEQIMDHENAREIVDTILEKQRMPSELVLLGKTRQDLYAVVERHEFDDPRLIKFINCVPIYLGKPNRFSLICFVRLFLYLNFVLDAPITGANKKTAIDKSGDKIIVTIPGRFVHDLVSRFASKKTREGILNQARLDDMDEYIAAINAHDKWAIRRWSLTLQVRPIQLLFGVAVRRVIVFIWNQSISK
jgi:hypothetical protein